MKIIKSFAFLTLAAVAVTLLFHVSIPRAVAQNNGSGDNGRKLTVIVYLQYFGPPAPGLGDQFTLAGTVARPEKPEQKIGTIAIQLVATAPQAALLNGVLNLPEGQISFTGLSPLQEPRIPGPITGGTGTYWNARGQVDHRTLPGGVEELILTFNGN